MKKIKLFGDLQTFKSDWELHVKTPGEALRAIDANRPGFLRATEAGDYVAILVDSDNPEMTRQVTMDNNFAPWANEVLMIIPRTGGDIPAAAVAAAFTAIGVTGVTATSFVVLAATALINVGLSIALSALANVITGNKQSVAAANTETPENKPSFVSNGPVNVVRAGHPHPIIVGEFLCGSIVLSSQVHVKDIPL